ncbi:MAG: alcohol dehydrogenase catalytic domain-containing protein [Candidatus Thermoplasmatota archaeon]|jgi:NADPH:quinone reductase-like Zn-dependent oxidoreductase|nr:alcohol dehydrogenase catalytic domain-containing protein [Candidatus Thermoplasmatota archaeon]
MKAVGFERFGEPEVLRALDLPDPVAGPGKVVLRLRYASVNHLDILVRQGLGTVGLPLPHVPGTDIVGTVETVGEGVEGVTEGETFVANTVVGCGQCDHCRRGNDADCSHWRTLGMHFWGSYAEKVVVPAQGLLPAPPALSLPELACLPLSLSVAWRALHTLGDARPGQKVLLWGASGNVGLVALQVARALGLEVFAVTRDPKKVWLLREMGSDHVVVYGEDPGQVAEEVHALTHGSGVDLVLEAMGGSLHGSVRALRDGGKVLLFGSLAGPEAQLDVVGLYRKRGQVLGLHNANRGELQEALDFYSLHHLHPKISRTLDVREAAAAHRALERSEEFGKIVLEHRWGE